ncbi:transcription factor SPT20 homolog [Aplysia californica]|uniref:Transcription factor SPT20 homolog n=1 Tax=Aplysia californica TaxID=6500 RepID=A0ABM0JMS7_APLCA|nr:transcription factor SPT20 homolog [Aplysia californica]
MSKSRMDIPSLPDIERAAEYAEYVLACSDKSPATFVKPGGGSGSSSKNKSIHQKLMDLYIEETMKQPEDTNLLYASHLLAKLAKRERLNCMVLSLYPGNEGYSIMLRSRSGVESETMKLPYEESEILEYVDAAQLPPFLLDLLEKAQTQMNVFYSGCVVVEIRDYRRSATGSHDTQYVLLRPSPQSMLRDVIALSCDGHSWTQDDLFHLESELILATEEPLCLDPSPAVMMVENALQYEEKFLNDPALKRCVKKNSQSALNRKRKLEQAPAPENLKLHDFLQKKKESKKPTGSSGLSKARLMVDNFLEKTKFQLTVPESCDVKKFAKLPEFTSTDGMIFVEEHTMERDPGLDRHMMAKISIWQPQPGDNYFGEFYLDYDYSQGRSGEEGRRCRFVIGARQSVDRYLQQFKDLFTEEGKRQVKISIQKANEPAPSVYYTQVVPQVPTAAGAAPTAITINNAQTLMKQVAAGQPAVKGGAGDMGSVASLAAKCNIPIQLSLSISPAASLSSSQGIIAQPTSASLSSSMSAQYIASAVPTAVMTAQRIKAPASLASQHRANSSPLTSATVSAKVSTTQQGNLSSTTPIIAIPKSATPTPVQTPPPNARTPTPTGSRRSSVAELTLQTTASGQQQQTIQQQNLTSFIQGLSSGTAVVTTESQGTGQQQSTGGIANISIGNLSSLPPNINIQGLTGLPGVNITNLSGLQQMQIAVPITMINNSLQAQAGLLGTGASTTSTATLVTMVTALPASSSSSPASSTSASVSSVPMSTGQSSNSTTVLPQGSSMLSFPVGLSGLTQIMPVSSKTQTAQGMRTPMPFLQLQGQQGIQLLSLQQQQRGVKSATLTASSTGQQGVTKLAAQGSTSTVPLSTVLTSQQMTALAVGAKPGQQLIQLASGGSALGQGPSQLATHVAIQKGQAGGQQTLQFHSLQLKPTGATLAQAGVNKSKNKKRTTPTPPK